MTKMLRVLSFILIASVLLFPVTANAAAAKSFELGKLFKDKEAGFQIKLPKGWKRLPASPQYRVQVLDEKTGANINVTFSPVERDFETELADVKTAFPQLIPGYEFTDDRPFKIKRGASHLIGGTFPVEDTAVQNLQLLAMKNKRFYVVTATAAQADWKRYNKFFLKIFKTFKF